MKFVHLRMYKHNSCISSFFANVVGSIKSIAKVLSYSNWMNASSVWCYKDVAAALRLPFDLASQSNICMFGSITVGIASKPEIASFL